MLGLSDGCFWRFAEKSLVMLETIVAEVVGLRVGSSSEVGVYDLQGS